MKSTTKKRDLLDTVLRYIACWKNKDWANMAAVTQRHWRLENHPVNLALKKMYDNLNILDYSVDPESKRVPEGLVETGVIYDLDVTVKLLPFNAVAPMWRRLTFRIILENADGKPVTSDGEWGVNPVSTYRGLGNELA